MKGWQFPSCMEDPNRDKQQPVPPRRVGVKRKFPGPAGVLAHAEHEISCSQVPLTQATLGTFDSALWHRLMDSYSTLQQKYDIKWISKQADSTGGENDKVPFLCALIKDIEGKETKNPSVKLHDPSGEIEAEISLSLYKKYSKDLIVGSGVVLRRCGVFSICQDHRNHLMLTITERSLIRIYNGVAIFEVGGVPEEEEEEVNPIGASTSTRGVVARTETKKVFSFKKCAVEAKGEVEVRKVTTGLFDDLDPDIFLDDF